jgi:hypothetical protein
MCTVTVEYGQKWKLFEWLVLVSLRIFSVHGNLANEANEINCHSRLKLQ